MPYNQAHNLFQLWKLNGERLPFKARKETWHVSPSNYMLVERVEIAKWPYGKAWGRYVADGQPGEPDKIKNAGTYTWMLVG